MMLRSLLLGRAWIQSQATSRSRRVPHHALEQFKAWRHRRRAAAEWVRTHPH